MSSINHHVTGQQYWRSLEQLAETPAVADFLEQEFPGYDAETIASTSRRGFLKLMGASMALAGITLTGCRRWPREELAPYASNPRGITPGMPERYATSWEVGGVGQSLLVTSYDGRPIKIEGNPDHPASRTGKVGDKQYGSADAFAQASILEMYDPDRSRRVMDRSSGHAVHSSWDDFLAVAKPLFAALKKNEGAGFAILSEATSSPSVAYLRAKLEKEFKKCVWYEYEPLSRDNEREGAKQAFGVLKTEGDKLVGITPGLPLRPVYHLDKAKVVVSLDSDLLGTHPNRTRYANDWAKKRRSADDNKTMIRVYVAESGLSLTGSVADERLGVDPSRIHALAHAIAARLEPSRSAAQDPLKPATTPATTAPPATATATSAPESPKTYIVSGEGEDLDAAELAFVKRVVVELEAAGIEGLVAVGHHAPKEAHALAFAINAAIHAVGHTVTYYEEADPWRLSHFEALTSPESKPRPESDDSDLSPPKPSGLVAAINRSEAPVTTLLILGGNPVYDAPADANFAAALAKVPNSIHLSLYDNETSRASKWHLPRAHFLESWGDTLTWDDDNRWQGIVTLQQPLILPLFDGKSVIEVLALLLDDAATAGDEIIRRTQRERTGEEEEAFSKSFRQALERGFYPTHTGERREVSDLIAKLTDEKLHEFRSPKRMKSEGYTLRFEQDSKVYDGRFANNGWLQETPDPLSKLMWDNALLIGVKDASELQVDNGDLVEITVPSGEKLTVPICLLPGQPRNVVSLSLGYGRTAAGPIGNGLGFNSYAIRTSKNPWFVPGVKISKTGRDYLLVTSAEHHLLSTMAEQAEEYRVGKKNQAGQIVREATLEDYKEKPVGGKRKIQQALQLFQEPTKDNFRDLHAWGMAIDLTACIGCNACAVACQAENNIPIVGKDQCYRHREMNWIRIDRYFKFDDKPRTSGEVPEPDVEDPNPEIVFQPMTCQHCENAPCEQVCPVAATVHDSEGLNTMVYNRCVGTRYCSNNCPYKVRRFNYFDFHAEDPRSGNAWMKAPWLNLPDAQQLDPKLIDPIKRMVFNPEVTVRMRGVMEKCTYCVQRIHTTVIHKRAEGKDVVDGDIITACQQACPTEAIIFGNLNDRQSKVSTLQETARTYDVLHEELNTRPRTRYLAKLRNPNPEAEAERTAEAERKAGLKKKNA